MEVVQSLLYQVQLRHILGSLLAEVREVTKSQPHTNSFSDSANQQALMNPITGPTTPPCQTLECTARFSVADMGLPIKSMGGFLEKFLLLALLVYFIMKIIASINKLDQQGISQHKQL